MDKIPPKETGYCEKSGTELTEAIIESLGRRGLCQEEGARKEAVLTQSLGRTCLEKELAGGVGCV